MHYIDKILKTICMIDIQSDFAPITMILVFFLKSSSKLVDFENTYAIFFLFCFFYHFFLVVFRILYGKKDSCSIFPPKVTFILAVVTNGRHLGCLGKCELAMSSAVVISCCTEMD